MKWFLVTAGTLLVLGVPAAIFVWPSQTVRDEPRRSGLAPSTVAHASVRAEPRLVLVAARAELGKDDGTMWVGYERGVKPPETATEAVVTTDENCTPDAQGVSHCRNDIRLTDGSTIGVRHDHVMQQVPCLVPGERVRLRAA